MREGEIAASETFPGTRACVEELMPRIENMLSEQGLRFEDIGKFGVDVGPGGLTGIKIGLVTVRTMAQIMGRPVAPVSGLEAACLFAPAGLSPLVPVAPCVKGECFAAVFRRRGGDLARESADRHLVGDGFEKFLLELPEADSPVLLGGAAEALRETALRALGERARFAGPEFEHPDAAAVCRLAAERPGLNCLDVQPNYLCLTNAERVRGVKI